MPRSVPAERGRPPRASGHGGKKLPAKSGFFLVRERADDRLLASYACRRGVGSCGTTNVVWLRWRPFVICNDIRIFPAIDFVLGASCVSNMSGLTGCRRVVFRSDSSVQRWWEGYLLGGLFAPHRISLVRWWSLGWGWWRGSSVGDGPRPSCEQIRRLSYGSPAGVPLNYEGNPAVKLKQRVPLRAHIDR